MMSSDDYFDDDLDSGILNQLDVIEAAYRPLAKPTPNRESSPKPVPPKPAVELDADDSFVDFTLDIDEAELQRLDSFIDAAYQGKAAPVTGPSKQPRSTSKNSLQTTLFGDIVHLTQSNQKTPPLSRGPMQRTKSNRSPFGQQAPQTKQWDHTTFAKSGWRKTKSHKVHGKENAGYDEEGENEDEEVEFEQFPAPFVPVGPPPPMKLKVDMLEAKHWIYPLNQPKRDYQFNIVKHCLYENTLVALPTGLGKTFIAGVVMLNFYRWFPEGKLVFVAPTKPLVAQQIDACHRICGIPGRDAIELTGNNARDYRSRMWQEKRLFYMTPQTLINDLASENCDPRDIILTVIDEAHKGTGNYAYAQVIRFLMVKNPHFRVLALTATPGSTPEAIQAIIDSLHISRIEIRDERSLDLREYMHHKEIKQHVIKMSSEILLFQHQLKAIMEVRSKLSTRQGVLKPLVARGAIEPLDVVKMHPYRARATMQRIGGQRNSLHKWALGPLSKLAKMARAMGYLMEASIKMCHNSLQELVAENEKPDDGKKGFSKGGFKADTAFQKLLVDLEAHRSRPDGYVIHPKMETLKMLLLQHFGARAGDISEEDGNGGGGEDTRAMVFVTYRECVDEIVEILNQEAPLLKATKFVGQGVDKQGRKGFAQREQLEVIRKFRAGEFNILVSTSIGEEGLDIGEVDMIVCYDAQKTPIRMLQRVGRTGRKRDGFVHVLLSEIREELNWEKAQDTYGELQKCIVRGDQLELYGDVPRLLPDHLRPEVLEKKMEIEEYVREDLGRKKSSVAAEERDLMKGKKRKRNDDIGRNIPPGAANGFVSVADLVVKKKKVTARKFNEALADDDSTDMELQTNIMDMRRTVSTSATADVSSKGKARLRKSRTADPGKGKVTGIQKKNKMKTKEPLTASQFSRKGNDDNDDMVIEQIISHDASLQSPSSKQTPQSLRYWSSSPNHPFATSPSREPRQPSGHGSDRSCPNEPDDVADPGDGPASNIIELMSSPSPSRTLSPQPPLAPVGDSSKSTKQETKERSVSMAPLASPIISDNKRDIAWLLDDDEDPEIQILSSPPVNTETQVSVPRSPILDDSVFEVATTNHVSPLQQRAWRSSNMPPPALPRHTTTPQPATWVVDHDVPESSFAVRPAGKRMHKRTVTAGTSNQTITDAHSPLRRLKRKDTEIIPEASTPPPRPKQRLISVRHHPWLDGEAIHSGDEESEGSSNSEGDVESESDRQFLKDMPDTQVSPSYNQALVYRQSLLTQAPGVVGGPLFANKPVKRGGFITARERLRRQPTVSSSPQREDEVPDEYAIGSFVVDDSEDIEFD
ncbi:P-loop containing nucleoside triphosphate hydrolase protein [Phlebopus sp. FC_14]|nr:P-loop containing nucleoside triphosphate hydrolase protein [Phlebopus sp. FC_14]